MTVTTEDTGLTVRTERAGETASTAVAAQAKAMIESRYVMAMRYPRDMDQVRQDLIKECKRPWFAHNKSALYHKPIGNGVEGLGIRFVEVALRCMGNVLAESLMIYSDTAIEIHRVLATDLEANTTWQMDITVTKTVERSKPADDGSFVSVRNSSYGRPVYTVPAQDDDLLNKRLALISKASRTIGLRLIPGYLQDEAEAIIRAIRLDAAAKDPDAERKNIADAFAGLGVKATDLQEYLGHALDGCTPAELVDLRGLYGALKDGEATWVTVMETRRERTAGTAPVVTLQRPRRASDGPPPPSVAAGTVASTVLGSDGKTDAERGPEKTAIEAHACDGQHAGEPCADPQCWAIAAKFEELAAVDVAPVPEPAAHQSAEGASKTCPRHGPFSGGLFCPKCMDASPRGRG